MINQIRSSYSANKFFVSTSPYAKFLNELKDRNTFVAAHAYAYFANTSLPIQYKESVEGVTEGYWFKQGVRKNIDAERKSLSELRKRWDNNFADSFSKINTQIDEATAKITIIQEQTTSQEKDFSERTQHEAEEVTNLIESTKEKLQELEIFYRDKLAFAAPIEYWKKKTITHRNFALVFGIISFIAAICFLFSFESAAFVMLPKVINGNVTQSTSIDYHNIAVLSVIAIVCIWIIRVLLKLFLSNLHLAEDANERVTMIQTYLALKQEEKDLKDDDRELILQSIFRPTSNGIIKDDGIPPSFLDIATRMGKNK